MVFYICHLEPVKLNLLQKAMEGIGEDYLTLSKTLPIRIDTVYTSFPTHPIYNVTSANYYLRFLAEVRMKS